MNMKLKFSFLKSRKRLIYIFLSLSILGLSGFFPFFRLRNQDVEADFGVPIDEKGDVLANFPTIESNSLVPLSSPSDVQTEVVRVIQVLVTGYSSSISETDNTPTITANGSTVKDGIAANNLLPFGTKVKLPEIFGDKVFEVEDRMNSRMGYYSVDIWFPSRQEALNLGAKITKMEILKEI